MQETIFIGGGGEGYATPQSLKLKYANRHGLIAGATGTGKTVTLQIMAEEFSAAGVTVFLSDVKSDLAGLAKSGSADFKLHDAFTSRAVKIGFHDYSYSDFPVVFWGSGSSRAHNGCGNGTIVAVPPVGIDRGARGHFEHCVPYRG